MSLPLTVAWKYQSFHVCGGGGERKRLGGVDFGPALYAPLPTFAQIAEKEK